MKLSHATSVDAEIWYYRVRGYVIRWKTDILLLSGELLGRFHYFISTCSGGHLPVKGKVNDLQPPSSTACLVNGDSELKLSDSLKKDTLGANKVHSRGIRSMALGLANLVSYFNYLITTTQVVERPPAK